MRKISSYLILFLLTATLWTIPVLASNSDVKVFIDGRRVLFPDQPPVVMNGRALVPLRFITEAMGGDVEWLQDENRINIYLKYDQSQLPIPDPVFYGWSSTTEGIGGVYLENSIDFENVEVKVENITYPELNRLIVRTGPERRAVTLDSEEWTSVNGRPNSIAYMMTSKVGDNLVAPRVDIPLGTVIEFRLTFRRGQVQRVVHTVLVYGENDHIVRDGVRVPKGLN